MKKLFVLPVFLIGVFSLLGPQFAWALVGDDSLTEAEYRENISSGSVMHGKVIPGDFYSSRFATYQELMVGDSEGSWSDTDDFTWPYIGTQVPGTFEFNTGGDLILTIGEVSQVIDQPLSGYNTLYLALESNQAADSDSSAFIENISVNGQDFSNLSVYGPNGFSGIQLTDLSLPIQGSFTIRFESDFIVPTHPNGFDYAFNVVAADVDLPEESDPETNACTIASMSNDGDNLNFTITNSLEGLVYDLQKMIGGNWTSVEQAPGSNGVTTITISTTEEFSCYRINSQW